MTYRIACRPDCSFRAQSADRDELVAALTTHMWERHRLRVDPAEAREMLVPAVLDAR